MKKYSFYEKHRTPHIKAPLLLLLLIPPKFLLVERALELYLGPYSFCAFLLFRLSRESTRKKTRKNCVEAGLISAGCLRESKFNERETWKTGDGVPQRNYHLTERGWKLIKNANWCPDTPERFRLRLRRLQLIPVPPFDGISWSVLLAFSIKRKLGKISIQFSAKLFRHKIGFVMFSVLVQHETNY